MYKLVAPCMIVMLLAGCSTLKMTPDYSALPEDSMKQIAREIETAVQNGDREAKFTSRDGIVVDDEVVMQAIRTRAARAELVNSLLASGFIWERLNGLIDIRTSAEYKKATTRRQRDTNALTVIGENADRWAIYEGIVKSSNFSRKALPAVQRIFHEARVQVLADGQSYEDQNGNVVLKGASR